MRKATSSIAFLIILAVIAATLAGCGKSSPAPSPTPEPTAAPTATPAPTEKPTPEPSPTPEPTPEPPTDPIERAKWDIETTARDICAENYANTDVDSITVNEDYGTDEDGDYILLVYATWNVKNSAEMTEKMLAMYSEDFAARIGQSATAVSEFTVFWTVPYYSETDTAIKYSYQRSGDGMFQTDYMSLIS